MPRASPCSTLFLRRPSPVAVIACRWWSLDHGQPDGAVWDGVQTFKAYARSAGLPVLRFVHPRWTGLVSALSRADADVYYTSCAGGLVGQIAMFCAQPRQALRVPRRQRCGLPCRTR